MAGREGRAAGRTRFLWLASGWSGSVGLGGGGKAHWPGALGAAYRCGGVREAAEPPSRLRLDALSSCGAGYRLPRRTHAYCLPPEKVRRTGFWGLPPGGRGARGPAARGAPARPSRGPRRSARRLSSAWLASTVRETERAAGVGSPVTRDQSATEGTPFPPQPGPPASRPRPVCARAGFAPAGASFPPR